MQSRDGTENLYLVKKDEDASLRLKIQVFKNPQLSNKFFYKIINTNGTMHWNETIGWVEVENNNLYVEYLLNFPSYLQWSEEDDGEKYNILVKDEFNNECYEKTIWVDAID